MMTILLNELSGCEILLRSLPLSCIRTVEKAHASSQLGGFHTFTFVQVLLGKAYKRWSYRDKKIQAWV